MRLALAFVLALGACGPGTAPLPDGSTPDGSLDAGGSGPTFTVSIAPIFTRSCAISSNCHAGGGSSGLSLTAGSAHRELVGVMATAAPRLQRVVAGDPEQSFLVMKLEGTHQRAFCPVVPNCGTRMPMVGGASLSASEIALIRQWIVAGAPL